MTKAALSAVSLLLTAAALAGCTASSRPVAVSRAPASTPRASLSAPLTTAPASGQPTTSSSPPSSTTSAPPSSTPPSTPAPTSTCTDLTIRVILGAGAEGYELAALQFVNNSTTACTLVGVPTVTLFHDGSPVGTASTPSTSAAAARAYRLLGGATAQSTLKDFSSCNAPLSTTIKVVAPGGGFRTTRPGQLRACRLVAYPLGAVEQ